MDRMKRIFIVLFSLVFMFSLVACSNGTDEVKTSTPHIGGQTETQFMEQFEMEKSDMLKTEVSDSQEGDMRNIEYHTQEIWCKNGQNNIYGIAYIPETSMPAPLIIFSHELGNSHTSGVRYAEKLAAAGYAAYVFDFCGGSAPGTENKSDGSNSGMSVMTEVSDLEAVLETAGTWDFIDPDKVFLLGGSQGGLVTAITGNRNQDQIAGMMLMYPALSAKDDINIEQYATQEDVPSEINLFGGWMRVGKNYVTDIWDIDFNDILSSYKGEMLLLHGDKDATVPLSYSEEAKNVIPHCEFHVIEGGGHEFYGQPFEDAMEYILSYIQAQLERREQL